MKVLILEDHADAAEVLGAMVNRWGHEARLTADGVTALRVADEYRPDVMLLDIVVPRLHGYEVARQIRRRPWGLDIRLVAISAWGEETDRRLSAAAGIDQHFLKPIDAAKLRRVLEQPPVAAD